MSETDALTGLPNRRKLVADLEAAVASGARTLLMFFDLNGFKSYNDAFGHVAGDSLLARLGARLYEAVQPDGMAYRLGGDEFCVIATPPEERRLEFEVGEQVRVTSGPFADFNGVISDIDVPRSKLTVLVNIFGRETPVELEIGQVAKL